jgi:hypothetical protein
MPALFLPQINGNMILTQLPYSVGSSFSTAAQDLETGIRWSYGYRGTGLTGYPSGPLGRFAINFPMITDAEVAALEAFHQSVRGRWMEFSLLDPAGNLLQFSQDFSNVYWTKTSSQTPGQADPFGQLLGTLLSAGYIEGVVGPSAGGMSGFVMCASIWLQATGPGITAQVGFLDNTTSTYYSSTFPIPQGGWLRVHSTLVLPTNNQFLFKLILSGSCLTFGAQVSSQKGEGGYAMTPGRYGYHAHVRFDVDSFSVTSSGPNQNSLLLPVVEVNG